MPAQHKPKRAWPAIATCWLMAALLVAVVIGLLLAFGCVLCRPAHAHDSWISRGGLRNGAGEWCCGPNDCAVIPSKLVELHIDGYHLHSQWDGREVETVPFNETQPSPDGAFWRCKRPDGSRRCFFAPPPNT